MKKANAAIMCLVLSLALSSCANGQSGGGFAQTAAPQDEGSGKIELILGGVWAHTNDGVRSAVASFNQKNELYQIRVVDYVELVGDEQGAWTRLQTELMAGQGPDIIYDPHLRVLDRGPLIDLYPLIDGDAELDRADFFPNMLHGMERQDGTLPMFTNSFYITTMVGMKEYVGDIQLWTPSELLRLAEETPHMTHPFGAKMSGTVFVGNMLAFNREFIDTVAFEANLDNESFIHVLEVAKRFPRASEEYWWNADNYPRMMQGEQILADVGFLSINDYQVASELLGDALVTLGMPTSEGGVNILVPYAMLGINAASNHVDAAWEFLRGFLLEMGMQIGSFYHSPIPLRIDKYEAIVADAMTPLYTRDENGNDVETPRDVYLMSVGADLPAFEYELYALTDRAIAENFRAIVESATLHRSSFGPGMSGLIYGDIEAFFDGMRTAEETARIMQNRLEIYLSEQELR